MFRALYAHHQEAEIVSMQHLVSSLSESDDTRCCIDTISASWRTAYNAQNM